MSSPGWKPSYLNQERSGWSGAKHRPFDLTEAKQIRPGSGIHEAVQATEDPAATRAKYLNRMSVKVGDNIVLIPVRDVVWVQSHGNLLRLHLPHASYEHRMTMKDMYRRLDPERFLRVHRSAIVNLDRVLEFEVPRCGNAFVHLSNGQALPVSRAARSALRRGLLSQSYASAEAH